MIPKLSHIMIHMLKEQYGISGARKRSEMKSVLEMVIDV